MISFESVSLKYPSLDLKDVVFSIGLGLSYFSGPSGCGKSTIFRLIIGERKPDRGRVYIDGNGPSEKNLSNGILSYYPAKTFLDKKRSLQQEVDRARKQGIEFCDYDRLVSSFHFETLKNQKTGKLSGGNATIACLIYILSRPASYYLLDEPFGALDREARATLKAILFEKAKSSGILLIDHAKAVKEEEADFIYDVKSQKVVKDSEEKREPDAYVQGRTKVFAGATVRFSLSSFLRSKVSWLTVFFVILISACFSLSWIARPFNLFERNDFYRSSTPYQNLVSSYNPLAERDLETVRVLGLYRLDFLTQLDGERMIFLLGTAKQKEGAISYRSPEDQPLDFTFGGEPVPMENDPFIWSLPSTWYDKFLNDSIVMFVSLADFEEYLKNGFFNRLFWRGSQVGAPYSYEADLDRDFQYDPESYSYSFLEGEGQLGLSGFPAGFQTDFGKTTLDKSDDSEMNIYLSMDVYKKRLSSVWVEPHPESPQRYYDIYSKDKYDAFKGAEVMLISPLTYYGPRAEAIVWSYSLLSFGLFFALFFLAFLFVVRKKTKMRERANLYRGMSPKLCFLSSLLVVSFEVLLSFALLGAILSSVVIFANNFYYWSDFSNRLTATGRLIDGTLFASSVSSLSLFDGDVLAYLFAALFGILYLGASSLFLWRRWMKK